MESTGGQASQNTGARREQLLRSALEVIVARGYADTRIADVAEHAGISPALVIYYFKTRDQLLTEALRYSEDAWYAAGTQRLAAIGSAVGRLTELIAMTCLPDTDPAARSEWLLWLDLWAASPRNAGVAAVRCKFDERWRETISSTVLSGPGIRRIRNFCRCRIVRGHAVGTARRYGRTNRPGRPGRAAFARL